MRIPRHLTPKNAKALLTELQQKQKLMETHAALVRAEARRNIISIARDLLPIAAKLGRRGRPRLLAVIAKIIGEEKLRSTIEKKS